MSCQKEGEYWKFMVHNLVFFFFVKRINKIRSAGNESTILIKEFFLNGKKEIWRN